MSSGARVQASRPAKPPSISRAFLSCRITVCCWRALRTYACLVQHCFWWGCKIMFPFKMLAAHSKRVLIRSLSVPVTSCLMTLGCALARMHMPTKVVRDHTTGMGPVVLATVLSVRPHYCCCCSHCCCRFCHYCGSDDDGGGWGTGGGLLLHIALLGQHPPWTMRQKMNGSHRTCPSTLRVYGYPPGPGGRRCPHVLPAEAPAYQPQELADGNWALETLRCCRQYPPNHRWEGF